MHNMKKLSKQDGPEKTYKIFVRPCSPFSGHDGDGEVIEITTPDIKWTMREYQRNRAPFIYEIRSTKNPK